MDECASWCCGDHDQLAGGRCHDEWEGIDDTNGKILFRYVIAADDTIQTQVSAGDGDTEIHFTITDRQHGDLANLFGG